MHEKNPNAPLSPFYINLRSPDNPNPGPFSSEDFDLIAQWFVREILGEIREFQAIAGIPRAGDPIVRAIERAIPPPRGFRIIKLGKEEKEGQRRIISLEGSGIKENEMVVLVDDLVTKADTKVEAISAIEIQGGKVEDLLVLVDREQGGAVELGAKGIKVHSCFGVRDLFGFYKDSGVLLPEKYEECLSYLNNQ